MLLKQCGHWLILLAASNCWLPVTNAQQDIETRFDVSFDASVGGNCNQYGRDRMMNQIDDSYTLAGVGVDMVDAATNQNDPLHNEAFRALAAYFNNPALTQAQYTQIRSAYQSVRDFLDGTTNGVNGGRNSLKPVLLCGDSWVFRQSMSDQAYGFNSRGGVALLTNQNRSPRLIQDDPMYVAEQAREQARRNGQATFPYWSSRLGAYIFDKQYGASEDPTNYVCSGDRNGQNMPAGITKPRGASTSLLILCEPAFRVNGRRLHAVDATCLRASMFVNNRAPAGSGLSQIHRVVPEADTMFHELFHIVLGNDVTVPNGGEEYRPPIILGKIARPNGNFFSTADNLANPQTYMFAAVSFDYTQNSPHVNGHPKEFYTGSCSFQQ